MSYGFVDLRLNEAHSGDEGFWPSFTDIMMVIVLIFLLSMLTLLLKNMDLVHQLQSSLQAERAATVQAQSTTNRNTALNMRLKRLEEESSMLRMRLMNLGEEHSRTLAQLSDSEQQNMQLKASLSATTQARDVALAGKQIVEKKQAELALRVQELSEQQQQYKLKIEELGKLKNNSATQLARLKRLELVYTNLEIKYNRLIRPARSPLGKVVVLVRYHKLAGKLYIEIKRPTDSAYQQVSGVELHKRLSRMQNKHGKKLYVRIIFPDQSGLSYTEAWNLTESLLRLYDYYYQER